MEWLYFGLGLIAWVVLRLLVIGINRAAIEYRRKRILKMVRIEFPDNEAIAFITVDVTDKRAMAKLERQLRAEFNIPEQSDQDHFPNRDGTGKVSRRVSKPGEDPSR